MTQPGYYLRLRTIWVTCCCLLLWVLALGARGAEVAPDTRVHLQDTAEYGYWAPEIHEMYLRLPVKVDPVGGDEEFMPRGVLVDGKPVRYTYWYVGGHTIDYGPARQASRQQIRAFIPVTWRANARHTVTVRYNYAGKEGEQIATFATPKTGGAWSRATGGNQAFMVREEMGLARAAEPVEFDLTVPASLFPEPERAVRATIMRAPGVYDEIPCQVYTVESVGNYTRFRAAVQLNMKPKSQSLVHLWACAPADPLVQRPIALQGGPLGGTVTNDDYVIELDAQSGALYRWQDTRTGKQFAYVDPRKGVEGNAVVIHRTPDVYRTGAPWSHTFDWKQPETRSLTGPVFVETLRWGPMPGAPELSARVAYRFFAGRPDVRIASSMRTLQDVRVLGFRMGGMILTGSDYTHVAWPKQDGEIVRVPIEDALGNDMGAPPASRFPFDTPWVAFYHREKGYGFALVTANVAYFSEGPSHPNRSQIKMYASWYRQYGLYTVRCANQTYCANVNTMPTLMRAGTVMYEEVAYLPFTFAREDERQFRPVQALWQELRHPLVVVP